MTNHPTCLMCLDDFKNFKSVMEDLVGWPVPLSWNTDGEAWITGPNLQGWKKAVLNRRFPAVAQIVSGLNAIKAKPQSAFQKEIGFYVMDDGIWRKKPFECVARFEFSVQCDSTG